MFDYYILNLTGQTRLTIARSLLADYHFRRDLKERAGLTDPDSALSQLRDLDWKTLPESRQPRQRFAIGNGKIIIERSTDTIFPATLMPLVVAGPMSAQQVREYLADKANAPEWEPAAKEA